jgi:hypothetical protein
MPIDTQSMLLKLSPLSPLNLGGGREGPSSAERERLKLARQQFDFERQKYAENSKLALLEENGRNARLQLEAQEKQRQEEAARQATLLAAQQGALQKFGEAAGSGKVQAAQAMSPFLDQLGYDVNNLGSVGGLPVFQLQNRAQEDARANQEFEQGPRPIEGWDGSEGATQSLARMQALGYPTDERGTLDEPVRQPAGGPLGADASVSFDPSEGSLDEGTADALNPGDADMATAAEYGGDDAEVSVGRGMVPASLSQGDAYAQALAASQAARLNGDKPVRGPDEEDYMGAVPRNVIDLPAMNAETNARLNPMLKSITGSLPSELQPGAEAAAKAAAGLGLEATDAAAEYKKAIDPALDIYKGEQSIAAQKAKEERLTPVQEEQLKDMGIKRANSSFRNGKVGAAIDVIRAADTVNELMTKGGKRNHEKAVNYLMNLTGNKGAQTEADALRIIGRGKLDSLEQLQDWLHERVEGGFSEPEIASINEFVAMQRASNTEHLYGWLATNDQQMRNPKTNERTRAGYEEFRNGGSIPPELLDQYEALAKKAEAGKPGKQSALDAGDLDSEKLGRVIGHESQGDATATSSAGASGTMQIMPDNLRAMGIEPEDFKKLSPEEQMPYNVRYLKGQGVTKDTPARDYALAVAAPAGMGKPDSFVIEKYRSTTDYGKRVREQNPGWVPKDGGEITNGSILAFYGLEGQDSEKPADKPAEAAPAKTEAKAATKLPEPKTPAEKRYLELLKKRGG